MEESIIHERKEKIFNFFKKHPYLICYVLLAVIILISVQIRTENLNGLRDVTTGNWTLGPDLDPFLFLRWADYISANGSIMSVDTMRNVPLGFDTGNELAFHAYLIAWFHKLASIFGSNSIEQSAAIFPVFIFALTIIFFFLWAKKTFEDSQGKSKAAIIALISSLFFAILPVILPRTIAGIPEKESTGFLFLCLSFYLFVVAWKSGTLKKQIIFALLAGASTAAMGNVWGGFIYVTATLSIALGVAFIFGHVNKEKAILYAVWLASTIIILNLSSPRYTLSGFLASTTTGSLFVVLGFILAHALLFKTSLSKYLSHPKIEKIPPRIRTIIVVVLLGIIFSTALFGTGFVPSKINDVVSKLVHPTTDRLGVTVAENRQPFFTEWEESFGPHFHDIAIFFWLFFAGSVFLFYHMAKPLKKKEKIIATTAYLFFLIAIIFSRYSETGRLNGENFTSLSLYALGFAALIGYFGHLYYKYYREGELEKLSDITFELILLFSFFFLSIVSARGAVRLIMILVPSISIIVGYFMVAICDTALKSKDDVWKIVAWISAALVVFSSIFAAYQFYYASIYTAQGYVPSGYNQQWQKAMAWVRDNTSGDAVFGHWWDYGYWIQSIGKRATVLDGGNALSYWNHLMGRHALTGSDNSVALEFLYAHNTTHFLIDPTDIGKYGAFSSIGSDENYDRSSWLPILQKNPQQTYETKNSTRYLYLGGTNLDGDIIYTIEGKKIFLPKNKAGLGAVITEKNKLGFYASQPVGIFVYQNQQYPLPLRYLYDPVFGFIDFEKGVDAGIYIMPSLDVQNNMASLDPDGALIYLSNKTVKSQLARLYLYNEDNANFKLVHSEDDPIVSQLHTQGIMPLTMNIVNYQGFRGPMKIWEIDYPSDTKYNEEFIKIEFPNPNISRVTQ
jgi:asparagine N-glycosylation enzyme membrane subunit Stt3